MSAHEGKMFISTSPEPRMKKLQQQNSSFRIFMPHNCPKEEVVVMGRPGWREKWDDLQKAELGNLKSQRTHLQKKKNNLTTTQCSDCTKKSSHINFLSLLFFF